MVATLETSTSYREARIKTILWLDVITLIFLFPYAIHHIQIQQPVFAVLLIIISLAKLISIVICAKGHYLSQFYLFVMVPLYAVSLAIAFRMQGTVAALWAYPTILSIYIMLYERPALIASALLILAVFIPSSWIYLPPEMMIKFFITLFFVFGQTVIFIRIINIQQEKLQVLATKDPLTGVYNRLLLDDTLKLAKSQFNRSQSPMSLVGIDIDRFKNVNDEHGHLVGDEVLKAMGTLIQQHSRDSDRVFRSGGEEFLVLLFDTDIEQAARFSESLRVLIEQESFIDEKVITVSIGVAQLQQAENCQEWVARSDRNLYEAKHRGRNTVVY